MRAGGQALTLLGSPRVFLILNALSEGTKGQRELRRDAGFPAQSTLRGHLRTLETLGATAKHRQDSFPGTLEYRLLQPGEELLHVAGRLEQWLATAPGGPLALGSFPARGAIKGLVDGWNTNVLPALACRELSLTELDRRIGDVSYPTIERCLETMRLAQQIEASARRPRGTPYALTEWLRRGLVPLAFGARWEHRHGIEDASPICPPDVEDAFRLVGPLLEFPEDVAGICQVSVNAEGSGKGQCLASLVELREGRAILATVESQDKPDAWASGKVGAWLSTVFDAELGELRLNGDQALAEIIVNRLHLGALNGAAPGSSDRHFSK